MIKERLCEISATNRGRIFEVTAGHMDAKYSGSGDLSNRFSWMTVEDELRHDGGLDCQDSRES